MTTNDNNCHDDSNNDKNHSDNDNQCQGSTETADEQYKAAVDSIELLLSFDEMEMNNP